MTKRCVVTGIGVVSPVGNGKNAFWTSLTEGKSGIAPITYFDTSKLAVDYAGEVKDFDAADYVDETRLPFTGRYVHFAVAAAKMAMEDADIAWEGNNDPGFSVILGTTTPSCEHCEDQLRSILKDEDNPQANPFGLASIVVHSAAAEISYELGVFDSTTTVSTICTSGLNAVGMGLREIQAGRKDIVVAGSSESTITFFVFLGYIAAGLLVENTQFPPDKVMRPYDKDRCGGVMGEGASFLVLEELEHARLRGARIYGEVTGYGFKDKFRGPKSTKQTMVNSMRAALADARMAPTEIDYVSANGVSTVALDKVETQALKEIFGDYAYRLPVSAIKSMIGIPNSAHGPMQLASVLMSFQTDIIPPTINYDTPDPECDLDYVPNTARVNRVNAALVNTHAWDGGNAVVIAKRFGGNGLH
jgi:3-oxoacyl-[acyl-carrier-protein] synthase II